MSDQIPPPDVAPRTCADAAKEAGDFLSAYNAVVAIRPPTQREQLAALGAIEFLADTSLYCPDWLIQKGSQ